MTEWAAGIYVHAGLQEEATAENLGDIANIGFIVGERCVAVIDTGSSVAIGRRLRQAVSRVTLLPVCYVINTHVHPDHVFGNAAFLPDGPEIIGHVRLPAALATRGRHYLRGYMQELGEAGRGSEVVAPTRTVEGTARIDLGGRVLELTAWRTAHTDNDLTVYDPQTGTLWLSDLLFVERMPSLDGSLRGWLKVLESLAASPAQRVVAGHGQAEPDWRQALSREERYLRVLLDETRAALRNKLTLQQAVERVGREQASGWLLHEYYHRRNVTAAYAELEWED